MNHFLLHLLAENVRPGLRGRRIAEARLLPPVLSFAFERGGETRFGIAILSAPGPFFYVDSLDPLAELGTEVLRRIKGFAVLSLEVAARDRVIRFGLSAPRDEVTLSVSLFGSAAKVRVEGRDTVIESLDARETGGPLPARVGQVGASLADADEADFARYFASTEVPERAIPGLTRELLDSFRLPGGEVDIARLLVFRDRLLLRDETFLLATRKRAGSVSPVPAVDSGRIEPMALVCGPFSDAEQACQQIGRSLVCLLRETIVQRAAAPLTKVLSARKRLLTTLQEERRDAESFGVVRREANILASYQSRIPPGSREVTLPDAYGSGDITIRLDPSTPVREQIKKRFRLAAKLERKRTVIDKRIRPIEEEIVRLDQELAAARAQAELRDAVHAIDRAKRQYGLDAIPLRTAKAVPRPRELRRFDLDAQWFVLVGRSDRENDEITFRIASPDDIWLHAQGVAGSHVVLKSRGTRANPPHSVLEAAACIAAHYSKARRASMVPVIYTQRKYVRKFKGAKPGQVLCEREKTIFAAPELPEPAGE